MSGLGEPFECAVCHGHFTKGWTDEEAWDEALDTMPPGDLAEGFGETCDDCYRQAMAFIREHHPELLR